MKRTLVAVCLAATLPAHAAEWLFVFQPSSKDSAVFVDKTSARKTGTVITFWLTRYYSTPKEGVTSVSHKWRLKCNEGSYDLLAYANYDSQGKVVTSSASANFVDQQIIPGSLGDAIQSSMCAPGFPDNPSTEDFAVVTNGNLAEYSKGWFDFLRKLNSNK